MLAGLATVFGAGLAPAFAGADFAVADLVDTVLTDTVLVADDFAADAAPGLAPDLGVFLPIA